jgi:hypothetical protein
MTAILLAETTRAITMAQMCLEVLIRMRLEVMA